MEQVQKQHLQHHLMEMVEHIQDHVEQQEHAQYLMYHVLLLQEVVI